MESLQALDKRITTTGKLQGIVKSMKTLSAVNIRQYERALSSLDRFVEVIELGLQTVLKELPHSRKVATGMHSPQGIIVFGSDQGLCGRFNERLADFVKEQLSGMGVTALSSVRLLTIGARIGARLETGGLRIDKHFWVPGSVSGINANIYKVLLEVENWISAYGTTRVELFFNKYDKASAALPNHRILLPVNNDDLQVLRKQRWPGRSLPQYRVPPDRLFSSLIRQYLFVMLFRSQAESLAAEQASRLRSLQNAEKNIEEHIEELISAYRVKRQATITAELIDLVSGFKTASHHDKKHCHKETEEQQSSPDTLSPEVNKPFSQSPP